MVVDGIDYFLLRSRALRADRRPVGRLKSAGDDGQSQQPQRKACNAPRPACVTVTLSHQFPEHSSYGSGSYCAHGLAVSPRRLLIGMHGKRMIW